MYACISAAEEVLRCSAAPAAMQRCSSGAAAPLQWSCSAAAAPLQRPSSGAGAALPLKQRWSAAGAALAAAVLERRFNNYPHTHTLHFLIGWVLPKMNTLHLPCAPPVHPLSSPALFHPRARARALSPFLSLSRVHALSLLLHTHTGR